MPQAQIERKIFAASNVKADDQQGIVEAIVAVFNNRDRGDDIIRLGAFAESLRRKLPKGIWHHKWDTPIAKTLEARELPPGDPLLPPALKDLGGLYIKAQFNLETQRGKESFSDIQFGIIDEFSIGYRSVKTQYDEETETRELIEVELYEWSPVLVGMNPATALLSVKDDGQPAGLSLAAHSDEALACLTGYAERIKSLSELRAKEGRTISEANRARISVCCDHLKQTMTAMQSAHDDLAALLSMAEPKPKKDAADREKAPDAATVEANPDDILNELARFESLRAIHSLALKP